MATIRTAIQLQDGMSPVVRSMNTALSICINSFESMQAASGRAVDTSSLQTARAELAKASVAMDHVEKNILEADAAQNQLNNEFRQGQSAADGLAGKVKNIAIGIATAVGASKAIELSDTVAQTTARLDLMNDKQQTTADLQQMIFQSAQQARGAYQTTADAVGKLGMQAKDAFSSTAEIVAFTEQLNKTFVIAGTSTVGVESAMLQLTQAMAAGKLQGEELNAILDNAQPIVANIAKYMGVPVGAIKEMASEGMISAEIIKNAMFAAADETNKKFESMPKTFGQITTAIQNQALMAFQPVLQNLNSIANSDRFDKMVNGIIGGLVILTNAAAGAFDIMTMGAGFIAEHWSFIEPIIWGVVAAYAAYNVEALIAAVRTGIATGAKLAHAAASAAETMAIIALIAAQEGLNAALYACPLSWILMAIVALIVIFYLAVAAVNKFAGTSLSATGIIVGAFFWLGGMIYNVVALAWNTIVSFAEFLGNVFKNPTAATYNLFATIWNGIVEIVGRSINEIIGLINKLPGMELGFVNWGKGLAAKQDIQNGVDLSRYQMDYSSGNFMTGYNLGANVGNFSLDNISPPGATRTQSPTAEKIAETAANTGKMKDSLDISTEDLKYLRDIAEQEVINRFTTAEINVAVSSQNKVSSNMDLDGMTTYLKDGLVEAVQTAAEKVHK